MKFRVFFIAAVIFIALGVVVAASVYLRVREKRGQERLNTKVEDVKVTLIEGWTDKEIADQLEKQGLAKAGDFLTAERNWDAADYSVLASKPKSASLEGFLFPDTYLFAKNGTVEAIIKKLLDNFEARLASLPPAAQTSDDRYIIGRYEALMVKGQKGMSLFQIVTLASIIEKETGRNFGALNADQRRALDEERKTIAGIFYNRLQRGMALQSDATINFITGKNDPAASAADLEIDSPYNTYKYPGLPPGPICNPSLSSIAAALAPIETDYLYFFHRQPSGEVVYSRTFEEHVRKKQ